MTVDRRGKIVNWDATRGQLSAVNIVNIKTSYTCSSTSAQNHEKRCFLSLQSIKADDRTNIQRLLRSYKSRKPICSTELFMSDASSQMGCSGVVPYEERDCFSRLLLNVVQATKIPCTKNPIYIQCFQPIRVVVVFLYRVNAKEPLRGHRSS